MASKKFPDGVYDFRSLVLDGYHFVDKTMMIEDVCEAGGKVLLYTRPRRFGKSINLSMLDYFFNLKYKDEPDIFKGLKISSREGFEKHKNAYPVIRMDFSKLSPDLDKFDEKLADMLYDVAMTIKNEHSSVLNSDNLNLLNKFISKTADKAELDNSISKFCNMLSAAYGQKVMIFVDEYDHSLQNIIIEKSYNSIVERIRPFMEAAFKTNRSMRTAVITGIMPLTKAGMLSSFNNPVVCDIFSYEGDEFFGFTESEVETLLADSGNDQPGAMDEIREWYDGYRFGDAEIYNPFSVIRYLKARTDGRRDPAKRYWEGSTGAGMSSELISGLDGIALQELKNLYEKPGYRIRTPLPRFITVPEMFAKNSDPGITYSYLAAAGYLRADPAYETIDEEDIYEIGMVNREIRPAFKSLVVRASDREESIEKSFRKHVVSGDADNIRDDLQFILAGYAMDKSWSGDPDSGDENERKLGAAAHERYKNAITSALRTCGMEASEEIPKGFGRCDIFVPGTGDDPSVAVEIKTSSSVPPVISARKARSQIIGKKYASEPSDGKIVWIALGINGKRVHAITGVSDPAA